MSVKEDIIQLLSEVKRDGIDDVIEWLASTDFFTAPASTKYHGNYDGGLADHSINTYDALVNLNELFVEEKIASDSLIIVGLLHDVCKIDFYEEDTDNASDAQIKYLNDLVAQSKIDFNPKSHMLTKGYVSKVIDYIRNKKFKTDPIPTFTKSYKVVDKMPMGHGEKSVFMITEFMDLTIQEALAIRWHLGAFDPSFHFGFPNGAAVKQAISENPLCAMLISADFTATWLSDEIIK